MAEDSIDNQYKMFKLIPIFIIMITGNSNTAEKSANASPETTDAIIAEISRSNNAMFKQVADLALGNAKVNGDKDYNAIDKGIKDRVIDFSSRVPIMTTTKLNMMENGKLTLSMTKDGKLMHHAMTPKERSYLSDILNDKNLDDSLKLDKVTTLVNSIAMNTQLQMNFANNMSQGESRSMHR